MNLDLELLTKIIDSCIDYGLFISDGECFWSESLRKRKGEYISKRKKKVEAGLRSAEVRKQNSESDEEQNLNNVETETEQSSNTVPTESQHNVNSIPTQIEQCSNDVPTQVEQCFNGVSTKSNKLKESKGKEIKEKEIFTSSSPPKSEILEEGEKFAKYFKGLLPPTQKVSDADLKNWGDTFDKLVRIDKRPREEIYRVTEWARKDSFWGELGNFLSACKLRSKSRDGVMYYDIFLQKYLKERSKSNGTANGQQVQRPAWITAKE